MDFTEYQEAAFLTCTPKCYCDEYLDLGYISEVGELAGKLAKRIRGDSVDDISIMQEIGDIAWMCAIKERLYGRSLKDYNDCFEISDIISGICDLLNACCGDDRWGILIRFCEYLGFDFDECLRMNLEKLASRHVRGVIKGDGDNR